MLAVVLVPLPAQGAVQTGPLYVDISGPHVMAVKDRQQFTVSAIGGPAEEGIGNYSLKARILDSPKGASVLPTSGTSADGLFELNVTAPESPMSFTLQVNITSGDGTGSVYKVMNWRILAINPIVITAEIRNAGSVDVQAVPVALYADGTLLHQTNMSIKAGSTKTFTYNWTDPDLRDGRHEVSIVLDPDREFITFEGGGAVYTTTIYVGDDGSGTLDIVLGIIVGLLIFITFVLYRRPKKRGRR